MHINILLILVMQKIDKYQRTHLLNALCKSLPKFIKLLKGGAHHAF